MELKVNISASDPNGNIYPGREIEFLEFVDRPCRWVHDIQQTFVSPNLELLCRLLVHVWRPVHRVFLDPCWQGNWTCNLRARPLGCLHDFFRGLIDRSMVVGSETNSDFLVFHGREKKMY